MFYVTDTCTIVDCANSIPSACTSTRCRSNGWGHSPKCQLGQIFPTNRARNRFRRRRRRSVGLWIVASTLSLTHLVHLLRSPSHPQVRYFPPWNECAHDQSEVQVEIKQKSGQLSHSHHHLLANILHTMQAQASPSSCGLLPSTERLLSLASYNYVVRMSGDRKAIENAFAHVPVKSAEGRFIFFTFAGTKYHFDKVPSFYPIGCDPCGYKSDCTPQFPLQTIAGNLQSQPIRCAENRYPL